MAIARILPGRPFEQGQSLFEHLQSVANRCAKHVGAWGVDGTDAPGIGLLAGLWHDLGKYADAFQQRLRDLAEKGTAERAPHAMSGAGWAWSRDDECYVAQAIAFAIAAHHAGLHNGCTDLANKIEEQAGSAVLERVARETAARGEAEEWKRITERKLPEVPQLLIVDDDGSDRAERDQQWRLAFFSRMLLSALVDADRLDAEASDGEQRPLEPPLIELKTALDAHLGRFANAATVAETTDERAVQTYRAHVLGACRQAADERPGAFTLTVPTGGGKTLSALAFALDHAQRWNMRRVVVAIPFTSIIEQTANVYRAALGEELAQRALLEHHSNVSFESSEEWADPFADRRRRATKNWDLPLIVTTNVQLLESLHHYHPSRVRKLHNLARSVIVFDEPQTFPPGLLVPICRVINELVEVYGCTVVLASATQPAISTPEQAREVGSNNQRVTLVRGAREIMPSDADAPALPRRVRVEWIGTPTQAVPYAEVAPRLAQHEQVLAIVHRRADARELAQILDRELELGEDAAADPRAPIHLSALMCPTHREQRIAEIRRRLDSGEPCRVASTTLIEAGVDVDFPCVYRALGGLDSVTQAAGRCNREGKRGTDGGTLYLFRAETEPPQGIPRAGLGTAHNMLAREPELDVLSPEAVHTYFHGLYRDWRSGGSITQALAEWKFRDVAREFVMIPDGGTSIVVPFDPKVYAQLDELRDWLEQKESAASDNARRYSHVRVTALLRRLQQQSVSVYRNDLFALWRAGAIEPVIGNTNGTAPEEDRLYALRASHRHLYHPRFGLILDRPYAADPATLIDS